MICSACHVSRDASDLIAFWPVGRPEARRFVCRPTCPTERAAGPCFSRVVGPANVHEIELAVPTTLRLAVSAVRPIVPASAEWTLLLNAAGVRRIAA